MSAISTSSSGISPELLKSIVDVVISMIVRHDNRWLLLYCTRWALGDVYCNDELICTLETNATNFLYITTTTTSRYYEDMNIRTNMPLYDIVGCCYITPNPY